MADPGVPERDATQSFTDVPPDHPAFRAVEACRRAGIFPTDSTRFRPDDILTRAEAAISLSRALAGGTAVPDPPTGVWTFADVPPRHEAFRYVEDLLVRKMIGGVGTEYFPTLRVDRAQLAVYLARAHAGGEDSVPRAGEPPSFRDVPPDHYAYRYVEYACRQGLLEGCEGETFRPEELVTREAFAVALARTFGLEA